DQGRSAGRGLPVHGRARNDSARHVPGRRALHDALPGDEFPPGTLAEAPRADGHPRQPGAALGGHRGGGRYRWRPGTGAGFRVADSSWRLGQPYLPHRILAGIGRTIPPRSVFALRSTRVNAGILRLPGVPFLFFFITHREGFPTYVSEVLKRYSLHPSAIRPPLVLMAFPVFAQTYDFVIANGRVLDPASNLYAVRHIGIRDGKIAAVS